MKKILLSLLRGILSYQSFFISPCIVVEKSINTLFYRNLSILLGLFYVGYKYKTKEILIRIDGPSDWSLR